MWKELLSERALPALRSREEMLQILQEEEYGFLPPKPERLTFTVQDNIISNFCAGKAVAQRITAAGTLGGREFSFPFYATLPTAPGVYPFFVHINFRDSLPDRYMPTEELIDHGYAVLSFCYEDVTNDNNDFTDKLAGVLFPDGRKTKTDAGKLAIWAWAAQRVLDYAETLGDRLLLSRAVVCGHSRLGKTALLAAATDERFACAYSNNSGCSGAAITRKKRGETAEKICSVFPYWFCESYLSHAATEAEIPLDQHFLLAAISPRLVCVGSAAEDLWADPQSEQLACVAASPAFAKAPAGGFVTKERFAKVGESFFDGGIGYHLRPGLHYFSRADWLQLIRFLEKHP